MRRALATAALVCGWILVWPAAVRGDRLWALQLQGGSVLLSLDAPEERGRTIVFHRHPDGLFSSLPSGEIRRITIAQGPAHKPKKSLDGQILVFGRDAEPPERFARREPPPEPPASDSYDSSTASGYAWATAAPGFPRGHGHRPHLSGMTLIGPNGYPILAPRGSFGFTPPPIGPNGFPVLAVTPDFGPRRRF